MARLYGYIVSLFLFFILIFGLSSCSYFKNVGLLTGVEIKREDYVQTLPFEWRKDLIVVKAYLNDDTTAREFIFDTGAFNSKVEAQLAESLGLEVVTEKENSTAQGITRKIEVVRVDSLRLGETVVYDVGAGKVNYGKTSASPCIAGSGIIGANIIKLAHWKIDYEKQLLYFSDKPFEVDESSVALPFSRPVLSGVPSVEVEVGGRTVSNILFDVGYNGGLVLPMSVADAFEIQDTQIILDRATSGIYGVNTDSLLVKELEVRLGGQVSKIPVEFSALNKALLGNEFLKHFTVVISYEEKKIYLQNRRKVVVAAPKKFLIGIENDSTWVVTRTTPESSFPLGEKLRSVNGKAPHEVFSSHCDYIMNLHAFFGQDSLLLERESGALEQVVGFGE